MRLRSNGFWVKWAYPESVYAESVYDGPPDRVNFCAFFWRCVLLTPVKLAFVLAILSGVCMYVYYLAVLNLQAWLFLITIVGLIAIGFVCVAVDNWQRRRSRAQGREPGFVATAYSSFKEKYCPIIEVEPADDSLSRD